MSLTQFPFLKPALWSYRLDDLDIELHKSVIIKNILNTGDTKSLLWLRNTYTKTDIEIVVKNSTLGEWTKKSANFWSFIYGVSPKVNRFSYDSTFQHTR